MKLYLRLIWLLLTQRFRSRCSIMGPVETIIRVYPNDLDIFMHVNNGVYLTYADLGRTDLMLRSNTVGKLRENGWYPVMAGVSVEFRQSLKLGQRFAIRTCVIGWDDNSVYMEQVFTRKNKIVARAIIDGRFLSLRGARVSNDELFRVLGINGPSPQLPEALQLWIKARKAASEAAKTHQA